MHRVAHAGGDFADDLPVRFQIPFRLDGLEEALEAEVCRRIDTFMLAPGGRRQNHIRRCRGFGHKDILNNHQLQILKAFAHCGQFGVGLERIFTHDVGRTHFTVRRAVRQFADAVSGVCRQTFHAPGLRKLLAVFREFDVLVARIGVRQRAHITRTLHVILTTHRVHAHMRFTQIAGQHGEAGERAHGFHALVELGHTHAPQNSGGFRPGIHSGRLTNLLRADAGYRFDGFRRIALDYFLILFKAFCTGRDKRLVVQVLLNNDVPHCVQQRDV